MEMVGIMVALNRMGHYKAKWDSGIRFDSATARVGMESVVV